MFHPSRMLPPALAPQWVCDQCRHGETTLLLIDGETGAGKTTLAQRVAAALEEAGRAVVSIGLDEAVPGWDGLAQGVERGRQLIAELDVSLARADIPAASAPLPQWDWEAMAPSRPRRVELAREQVLVVEGCGALACGAQPLSVLRPVRIWVHADSSERHARIEARDSYHWDIEAWERQADAASTHWRSHPVYQPQLTVLTSTSTQEPKNTDGA